MFLYVRLDVLDQWIKNRIVRDFNKHKKIQIKNMRFVFISVVVLTFEREYKLM